LYEKAISFGVAPAMHNLGVIYSTGKGVEKNPEKAQEYFQMAEKAGYYAAE